MEDCSSKGGVFLKKIVLWILVLCFLLPSFSYGSQVVDKDWIIENGYFGRGGLRLDEKITRAELAALVIRLMGFDADDYRNIQISFDDIENYQGGWAAKYISIAETEGLIRGVSKNKFNPSGKVSYNELLTVFMRVLGYKDGIDFSNYPDDYYNKALEIGISDMYVQGEKEITREVVLSTMEAALNTNLKMSETLLFESLTDDNSKVIAKDNDEDAVEIENLVFNTKIASLFKGNLVGRSNFNGYRVVLLSRNGSIYDDEILDKNGKFSMTDFDIGLVGKLNGYKYEIYDNKGNLILESVLD